MSSRWPTALSCATSSVTTFAARPWIVRTRWPMRRSATPRGFWCRPSSNSPPPGVNSLPTPFLARRPSMFDPIHQSATDLLAQLASGSITAQDVTRAYLDRIKRHDGSIHALLHHDPALALERARSIDARRAAGEALGALAGVPVVVKDVLCTRGVPTTCGSRILEHYRP